MILTVDPYSISLFLLAFLALASVMVAWSHPVSTGLRLAGITLILCAIWTFGSAMEFAVPNIANKIFWAKVSYVGIALVPTYVFFSIRNLILGEQRTIQQILLFMLFPITFIMAVFTNDFHHLLWTSYLTAPNDPNILIYVHGPVFWANLIYQYGLMFITMGTLLKAIQKPILRKKALLMAISLVPPWLTSLMYILGITIVPHLDITPLGFLISVPFLFVGVERYGFFEVAAMGKAEYTTNSSDPIAIIDKYGSVVESNEEAQKKLGIHIGQQVSAIDLLTENAIFPLSMPQIAEQTVVQKNEQGERIFALSTYPVNSDAHHQIGTVLVFRDMTDLASLSTLASNAQLEAAKTEERRKLSKEIHDRISQGLYSLSLFTASAKNFALRGNTSEALSSIEEIDRMARQIIAETNLLFYELEPNAFGKIGLHKALDEQRLVIKNRYDVELLPELALSREVPIDHQREIYIVISELLNIILEISRPQKIAMHIIGEISETKVDIVISSDKMIKSTLIKNHKDKFERLIEKIQRLDGGLEFNEPTPNNQFIVVVLPISNSESRL